MLDKENATARKGIFMIDASKGFIKDGNKNRLREQDIHKIVDTFNRQADSPRYARMVPSDEIASPKNDYNLNLPRYIDSSEPEDLQDIDAHLNGGIPERDIDAFAADWQQMPGLRAALFESAGRPGYARLKLPMSDVRSAILEHSEFTAFTGKVTILLGKWREAITPMLTGFSLNGHPKELIGTVSETLLASMQAAPLIDAYAVYQHLMDYWAETMQDDAYLIAADGWVAKPARIIETDKKGKKKDKGRACDLIPKPYIVSRYFAKEEAKLDAKQAELEAASGQITELEEEHSGEDAAFAGFDKINAAQVKDRVKEIGTDPEAKEELAVLKQWLKLSGQESQLKKTVKELDAKLDQQAHDHYTKLSVTDIKSLVVNDKWLARLAADLQGEIDRVGQDLTSRIRELAERYDSPLPQLVKDVSLLSAKVDEHLKRMGAKWN